jgi:hypothetical protein
MPHDGGKARAGLPLRLMRFTARSPGRTHGWQAGTSQMCGRRDLPDMSGINPVARHQNHRMAPASHQCVLHADTQLSMIGHRLR